MPKFRKKPVIIEAFRYAIDGRPDWFDDKVTKNEILTVADENGAPLSIEKYWCIIGTLEGNMRGNYGDYIIQGVQGEVYTCKPDIFLQTYESVE